VGGGTPVLCSMQLLRCAGGIKPAEKKGKAMQKCREEAYRHHSPTDFLAYVLGCLPRHFG